MSCSPVSFLQLRGRVDSGKSKRANTALAQESNIPSTQSAVSPSALARMLKAEKFMSLASPATAPPPARVPSATGGSTIEYRSALNLKWKSTDIVASDKKPDSGQPLLTSALKKTPTAQRSLDPLPEGSRKRSDSSASTASVFWRECKTEGSVRREAIFYNFLLTKSNASTMTGTMTTNTQRSGSSSAAIAKLVAGAGDDGTGLVDDSDQFAQPSNLSLLWDVSRVAATSHILGGDGKFFLRKEFMHDGGDSSNNIVSMSGASESAKRDIQLQLRPISIKNILKLFGNERTFQPVGDSQSPSRLHRATSYLLTESYACTLGEFTRRHSSALDAVQLCNWCSQVAHQLSEMHRAGVLHNNIHVDAIALCGDKVDEDDVAHKNDMVQHSSDIASVDGTASAASSAVSVRSSSSLLRRHGRSSSAVLSTSKTSQLSHTSLTFSSNKTHRNGLTTVKLSWLHCATMTDLQVVRGLRKQTLSQSRADPQLSEFHLLSTAHLPDALTLLAKTYPAVLPPEWFTTVTTQQKSSDSPTSSPPHLASDGDNTITASSSSASLRTSSQLKLRAHVTPTEKSDSFLFGKVLQQLFTNTMVEFNPQSVISVSSYYLSKSAQAPFGDCPSNFGKLLRVDEINSESLRHLITAATMDLAGDRWSMHDIACHPFFWGTETIVEFFTCVMEFAFPLQQQSNKHRSSAEPDASRSSHEGASAAFTSTRLSPHARPSLREAFREAAQRGQPLSTKKLNITAPELAQQRCISRQLSTWVVEPRNWMIDVVVAWLEALSLEPREDVKKLLYENVVFQQVEFLLNVYHYLRDLGHARSICGGDADAFVVTFVHRMFPTILMEAVAMTMNEEDGPKFARYLINKIRSTTAAPPSAASGGKRGFAGVEGAPRQTHNTESTVTHLRTILTVCEALCAEKSKSVSVAGFDRIVQYVGCFPQFPVHIPEAEKALLVKSVSSTKSVARSKPSLARLPKWAQEQIAAAED